MKKSNKKEPFKTPDGYFEGFADRLSDRLSEEGPALPKKEGFKVPEGYFEGLDAKLAEKVNPSETKVVQLRSYRKYYYIAASVAAIAVLVFTLQPKSPQGVGWDDLANSDIEAYFEDNEFDMTSAELADVLLLDQLELNDVLEDQLNEESIIEYLDDHIDDLEDLNLIEDAY
ncbi:hypothetical protein WIW50_20265 [Flavobacteriaceae bacterium 3-367]|uniref:hypothetical protein n=1 Tax=Eudoraea algarum TaxID=3417568 RepID=UPI003280FC98